MAKLTPEQQQAYDDDRASPGILFDSAGNVIYDGEAEASGRPPFKTMAEANAQADELQRLILERRKEREAEQAAADAKPRHRRAPRIIIHRSR